ncbi:hotdog fold thioesterase [Metallosphaera tengchongensis]|uniref:Hotdog fold thioesterase n=1 Tax=Metallosphaera tengchongensis TaxID=1532350 RepID=A0A6N0NYK4_9CREN|nr:hotdog fold thioesterase [Metallosphaera tengchongensis]QKR00649.1 hotdog fold thioesterase [Metallosphaera tengchongensis]
MQKRSPFVEHLNINVEEVRDGYARVSSIVSEVHLNTHGSAHGSFLFALADTAFEYVSNFSRDSVALHMDVDFRRPAFKGERVTAEAYLESSGKTTSLYRILVKNSEGKVLAYLTALAYHLDGRN